MNQETPSSENQHNFLHWRPRIPFAPKEVLRHFPGIFVFQGLSVFRHGFLWLRPSRPPRLRTPTWATLPACSSSTRWSCRSWPASSRALPQGPWSPSAACPRCIREARLRLASRRLLSGPRLHRQEPRPTKQLRRRQRQPKQKQRWRHLLLRRLRRKRAPRPEQPDVSSERSRRQDRRPR